MIRILLLAVLAALTGCGIDRATGPVSQAGQPDMAAYPAETLPLSSPSLSSVAPITPSANAVSVSGEGGATEGRGPAGYQLAALPGSEIDHLMVPEESATLEAQEFEYGVPLIDQERFRALELAQAEPAGDGQAGEGRTVDLEEANQAFANPLAQATLAIVETNTIFLDGDITDDTEITNVTILDPLIPVSLGDTGWSLVNRPILPIAFGADVPVTSQGGAVGAASGGIPFDNENGIGDFTFLSLLAPKTVDSAFKWGVGPVFRFPTATDDSLGAEKFSIGPAAVGLYSTKNLTLGVLNQNLFSVAGEGSRDDVAVSTFQYFAFYNFTPEWGIGTAPIISIDWEADDSDDKYLVPVGLGIARSFKIGDVPMRVLVEGQYYAVQRDTFGPEWNVRVALGMFFPPLFD